MMKFTNDELFMIEKVFDGICATHLGVLRDLGEKFLLAGCVAGKDVSVKDAFRKEVVKGLEELYKGNKVVKSIREKCEKQRLKKGV